MGNPNVLYNNMRVYGTILLLLLSIIVFVGVRYVSIGIHHHDVIIMTSSTNRSTTLQHVL